MHAVPPSRAPRASRPRSPSTPRVLGGLSARERRRVDAEVRLLEAARPWLARGPVPYVAHLELRVSGKLLDVLFASDVATARREATGDTPELWVVDWRRSPLTAVLIGCAEGERYTLDARASSAGSSRSVRDAADAKITGKVLSRTLVGFEGSELTTVELSGGAGSARFVRDGAGAWTRAPEVGSAFRPRPREAQRSAHSLIDVTLDPAQQAVVALPLDRSMLVLGEAGYGKTTVALHRLAHLWRSERAPRRAAVLVPTDGLRRLIEPLTKRLGIDVEVLAYDRWARRQARRAFPDVPARESQDARTSVIRFKRDPAIADAIAEIACGAARPIDDDIDAPRRKQRAFARRSDLQHLFGDRILLERAVRASAGRLALPAVQDVLEHTHVQFSLRAEREWAHVTERERLVTVDGGSIDDATPMQDAGTVDAEDYAVLFEIDRQRAARRGEPATEPVAYDCLVIDEAQELAPLELALIGRSLAPGGTLVVAGDEGQQLEASTCFGGWDETMKRLSVTDYDRAVLEVGYRCPPEVTAFARGLVGRGPEGVRAPEIPLLPFASECALALWLIAELSRLADEDPRAAVAIICRAQTTARRLHDLLLLGIPCRLVVGGDFSFRAGIDVTSIDQVRGLEFDYVVIADVNAVVYPDDPASRRALYVAATRTRHALVLARVGEASPCAR